MWRTLPVGNIAAGLRASRRLRRKEISRYALGPSCCATARRASRKGAGKAFFLFSARRSIPAHAVELKKYREGIGPVSRTCHNEQTSAALGNSEILGIEDAPCDCPLGSKHTTSACPADSSLSFGSWREKFPIEAAKSAKETPEGIILCRQDSGYVFPDNERRLNCICKLHKFQREVSALIGQAAAQSGDRKRLAGGSPHEHIHLPAVGSAIDCRHVPQVGNGGVMMREYGTGEGLDFSKGNRCPAEMPPGHACGFDARTDGEVAHHFVPPMVMLMFPHDRVGDGDGAFLSVSGMPSFSGRPWALFQSR